MRGYFNDITDISLALEAEEVSLLEQEVIGGVVDHQFKELPSRKVLLKIGSLQRNLFAEAKSLPDENDFKYITLYEILISPQGYRRLREQGVCIDRWQGSQILISTDHFPR